MKKRIFTVLLITGLAACTANKMYRPVSIEELPGYTMAYIELDDQGEMWSPAQLSRALAHIEQVNQGPRGALLVVFVHGWQHNASPKDKSLRGFQRFLDQLAELEREMSAGAPRPLVGVYLGWRGRSGAIPVLNKLTFWSRAGAVRRVAGISATEAIYSVLTAAKRNPRSKALLMGHSFGGQIVELALSQALVATLLTSGEREVDFPADLVVLVNPAAKSLAAKQLIDALERNRIRLYRTDADGERFVRPLVVSVTSRADLATGLAFQGGTFLSSIFKNFRKYGRDYCSPLGRQRAFYVRTPGHNRTLHNLEVSSAPLPPAAAESAEPLAAAIRHMKREYDPVSQQHSYSFNGRKHRFTLKRRPRALNDTPYWIMSVPPSLIPNHAITFDHDLIALLGALLAITGALEPESTTTMVREDGVRPLGMTVLPSGELIFVDRSRRIYGVLPGTDQAVPLTCLPHIGQPDDRIGFAAAGESVWLAMNRPVGRGTSEEFRTEVLKGEFREQGIEVEEPIPLAGELRFAAAAIDPGGQKLYLASGTSGEIYRADLTLKKKQRRPELLARLEDPAEITLMFYDSFAGRLYAADGARGTLYELDVSESAEPAARQVADSLGWPTAIAADPASRRLYVSDRRGRRIWVLDCSDAGCSEPRVFAERPELASPSQLAVGPDGTLWVGDLEAQKIVALSPAGEVLRQVDRLPRY